MGYLRTGKTLVKYLFLNGLFNENIKYAIIFNELASTI